MGSLAKILQNTGGTDEAKRKNIMVTGRRWYLLYPEGVEVIPPTPR
jgi:hypothetical protein